MRVGRTNDEHFKKKNINAYSAILKKDAEYAAIEDINQEQQTEVPLLLQKWQICWQKRPGYRGVSPLRRLCLSAKIETRTKNYIVVSYGNSQTNGVIEATAGGKSTYNGKWKDSGGWGKIYDLHFTSARTAMAWYDEDGRGRKDFSFVLERK